MLVWVSYYCITSNNYIVQEKKLTDLNFTEVLTYLINVSAYRNERWSLHMSTLPYSKKLWRGKNFGEFGEF